MKKLYEVDVRYMDGSSEVLVIEGATGQIAETEAEVWVDLKKEVKEIKAVREVIIRQGKVQVNQHEHDGTRYL